MILGTVGWIHCSLIQYVYDGEHGLYRRIRKRNVFCVFFPLTVVVLRALEPVTSVQYPYDPNGKCSSRVLTLTCPVTN